MSVRYSSESDTVQVLHEDGTVSTAQSIPFYQYSFLRLKWIPICQRHKLKFKSDADYNHHWTSVCEDYDYTQLPKSDFLHKLKGYKWYKS